MDVVAALTDSSNPAGYLHDMCRRDPALSQAFKGGANCPPLSLALSTAGGRQKILCWNTEGIFRLVQSIPSARAEPFKLWLAKLLKGLKRENLRDHMDDFELIFTLLGERATTEIHRTEDSRGVPKLRGDAKAGGDIAGGARKQLEKRLGRKIVSRENYLKQPESVRRKELAGTTPLIPDQRLCGV